METMPRHDSFTSEQIQTLIERYPTEGPGPLVGLFNMPLSRIRNRASKLGIKTDYRARQSASRVKTRLENYDGVDIHYFDIWNDRMAYALGYIWADGQIQLPKPGRGGILGLQCKTEDELIILNLRTDMKSYHKVSHLPARVNSKNGSVSAPATKVSICSSRLVMVLNQTYGIEETKSEKNLPFPQIPSVYLNHFSRGYLDGDGSVASTKNCLYYQGSRCFIEGFQDLIAVELSLPRNKLVQDGRTIKAAWYDPQHLYVLYKWLYQCPYTLGGIRKRKVLEGRLMEAGYVVSSYCG